AGAALHMQARSMARVLAQRELRLARAAALTLAATRLAQAESAVRAGNPVDGVQHMDTEHGRFQVMSAAERQAAGRYIVRVSVADDAGRVLSEYESAVEVESR